MIRKIIQIDEKKCNGCGACADACHEGAIGMVNGKAKLLRDDYCDGLGDCLPACPTGAITFVEREAAPYDKEAVEKAMSARAAGGCPGAAPREIHHSGCLGAASKALHRHSECPGAAPGTNDGQTAESQLSQWPVQIKLAPVNAPYFDGADLLVAADCSAYAYADFHNQFIRNRITLIGCPKLDGYDYSEKLTEIIQNNDIRSVTVVRMEVPCCGGIEQAVMKALKNSGKHIPSQVVTITISGNLK